METNANKIRPQGDASLGWAYRPDKDTVAAHNRFKAKVKKHYFNPGVDRPHEGGSGNLADALAEANKAEELRRFGKKRKRRKKMARKVTLREIAARKGSKKKTVASKKRTVEASADDGKKIPLKTICSQMGLDPKATRVKLRRMIAKGDIDWHDPNDRWEFTPKRAKEVRTLLS